MEPALGVEANLIWVDQEKLVCKELFYLSVWFASLALALLQLYIQLSRLVRVEVAVNEHVLLIHAKELPFVLVDEPFARFMDGEKAGLLVVSSFLTET